MNTSELIEHISLRSPLVWVTTDEPARVIDEVSKQDDRKVFRYDPARGLVSYSKQNSKWLLELNEDQNGSIAPIFDASDALKYVSALTDAVMVMEFGEKTITNLASILFNSILQYREAFYADDFSHVPVQFILLSHEEKVPDEFRRTAMHIVHELPTETDLRRIVDTTSVKIPVKGDVNKVVNAALGLSETEFINSLLLSGRSTKHIEASFVATYKKELLKSGGIIDIRTPTATLDDLGGLDNAKKLIDQIRWLWSNPTQTAEFGLKPLRRLLMVGVPGTGKSLICEVIASALQIDLGKGGISNAMSKWVGESEANMRRMFATLHRLAPIVLWIDEFGRDASGGQSSGSVDGGTTDRVHGEFLTGLQELPDNVFLAAAANRIDALPPEMLRADRFDKIMFVGFPTNDERRSIFNIHLEQQAQHHDIETLAKATPLFTGAEIKSLIREVNFDIGTTYHRRPTTQEILDTAPHIKGRVWVNHRPAIVEMYKRALDEWHWASSQQHAEAHYVLEAANHKVSSIPQYSPAGKLPSVKTNTNTATT